jgi:hypothetical protein
MPAGRKPVGTRIVSPVGREQVYNYIRKEASRGHQAFIIYPLVEEGDDEEKEGRAAIEASEFLQAQVFPDLKVALLHGRMKGSEKDEILEAFKNHEYDILVSTSVIEVGVDVPNATVMVIEGANHFGLAQLHQFRGRVGRGDAQAWCALIPDKENDLENQRLNAMVETTDGFKLAEMDLEMRGPGDFIGKRQSGLREMKLASMSDVRLIEKGHECGLVSDERYEEYLKKMSDLAELKEHLGGTLLELDDPAVMNYLEPLGYSAGEHKGVSCLDLIRRPSVTTEEIMKLCNEEIDSELAARCDIEIKYEGYIQKAKREAAKMASMENMKLGVDFNYDEVDNLSLEGRQKLMKYRPETMGQASRISGVNPADLAVLAIALKQMKGRQS